LSLFFSVMSLSYPAAMAELQTMFPTVEKNVLHVILESNGGHMEATIGCLLQMANDDSAKKDSNASANQIVITSSAPKPASPSHANPATIPQLVFQQHAVPVATPPRSPRPAPSSGGGGGGGGGGGVGHNLPDDFLRPPSYFKSQGSAAVSGAPLSQMDQDAQLAAMLQDEIFMQDLMKRPDIYMQAAAGPVEGRQARPVAKAGTGPTASAEPHGEKISEKFAHLGAAAKAKLAVIASKFKRTKKGGGGILNPSSQYRDLDSGEEGALNQESDIEMKDKNKDKLPPVPDM